MEIIYSVFFIIMAMRILLSPFMKLRTDALFCGIFGFQGKTAPNLAKIKMLGMFNVSRGGHSCGIYIDGKIIKGVDKLKSFTDLIQNKTLPIPTKNFTIIGHTRHATHGFHTIENAHPFLVNDRIVGCHNGVIKNIWQLCNKKEVNHDGIQVDSHALYRIIEKEGLEVLEEYEGKAALMWTDLREPNSLYVYHGASKETKNGDLLEERPLHFLETEEGVYFSSMESSLLAIKDDEEAEVYTLDYNIVFKVTDGEFTSWTHGVNREEKNVPVYTPPVINRQNAHVGNSSRASFSNLEIMRAMRSGGKVTADNQSSGPGNTLPPDRALIYRESIPYKAFEDVEHRFVYYHRGRYWHMNAVLCQGLMYIRDKGEIGSSVDNISNAYYFWDGIMLKDSDCYNTIVQKSKHSMNNEAHKEWNYASHMSKYSKFPICNLPDEGAQVNDEWRYCWYLKEKKANSFTPKFSAGRSYIISEGVLKEIKSSNRETTILAVPSLVDKQLQDKVEKFVKANFGTEGCGDSCDVSSNKIIVKANSHVRHSETGTNSASKGEEIPQFFTTYFQNLPELLNTIQPVERIALQKYLKDLYWKMYEWDLSTVDIDSAVNDLLKKAIDDKTTIKDVLEGDVTLLDYYYQVAKEQATSILRVVEEEEDDTILVPEGYFDAEEVYDKMGIEDMPSVPYNFVEDEDEETEKEIVLIDDAASEVEDAIDAMKELNKLADNLQANNCEYAQKSAYVIYKGLDNLSHGLAEVNEEYNQKELNNKINQHINVSV